MSIPSRLCAVALLAASLGACQGSGGGPGNVLGKIMNGGGVMPDSEVGPPPSMQSAIPNARRRTAANVDDDGNPLPVNPSRELALPKSAGGQARSADAASSRINRDDLAGGNGVRGAGSSANSMTPALTPSGGMGVGGKF